MKTRRTGAHVLLELLESEGVEYIFGNPGTTELPLIDALVDFPDISYIWGLQEASVVGMADGFAQASGSPSFVNLHTAGGLGHGMGGLLNASAAMVPMVVTAGQQDLRHTLNDPLLFEDLQTLASPVSKWTEEVSDAEQLPILVRRAFEAASANPSGPVFLSLPMNVMERETSVELQSKSNVDRRPVAGSIDRLSEKLAHCRPDRIAIIAGDEIAVDDAMWEAVELSEILACDVYGSSWPARLPFPTKHKNWLGNLPAVATQIADIMSGYDAIIALGGKSFITILYSEGTALPASTKLYQISNDGSDLGRTYFSELSLVGDLKRSLKELNAQLLSMGADKGLEREKAKKDASNRQLQEQKELTKQVDSLRANSTIHPMIAAHEIVRALPKDIAIVDESVATMKHIRSFIDVNHPKQYFSNRGGGLGWGMPAAIGVSLANDRAPVLSLNGDGASLYSPQAIWTAAHENLPIIFVILNNYEYNVLKNFMMSKENYVSNRSNRFIAMDLDNPAIDFLAMAKSMGLEYEHVKDADEIYDVIHRSFQGNKPKIVEIVISAER